MPRPHDRRCCQCRRRLWFGEFSPGPRWYTLKSDEAADRAWCFDCMAARIGDAAPDIPKTNSKPMKPEELN